MNLQIKKYDEVDDSKWNEFIYSNSMGWAYFLKGMIEFHRNSSFKNISFAIIDTEHKEEILLIIQLHMVFSYKKKWFKKKKIIDLTSQWGYILKDNLPKKTFNKLRDFFDTYINSIISNNNIRSFSIDGFPPLAKSFSPQNYLFVNPAIKLYFFPGIRYTYCIDLSKPDENLLADCHETTRQAIRKISASNNYEIYESKGNKEDCLDYIHLHKETYSRTKGNIISDTYHENMFFNLIPQKICRVFFLVDKASHEKIATVAILIFRNTAYYWWGASKTEKEIGINKFLLFEVIKIIKNSFNNSGYFEVGNAHPFLRSGKNKGLNDYKKSFGCFLHPIYTGVYNKK